MGGGWGLRVRSREPAPWRPPSWFTCTARRDNRARQAMRALVIEDHPRMSALLRQGLEEEGYAVDASTTLLDGMSLAGEHEFDAIVLDVMLPDGDGIDALRQL